jgi:hypothetical protein
MATVRHDDELKRSRPAPSDTRPGGRLTGSPRQLYGKALLSGPRDGGYLPYLDRSGLILESPATASETQEYENRQNRLREYR